MVALDDCRLVVILHHKLLLTLKCSTVKSEVICHGIAQTAKIVKRNNDWKHRKSAAECLKTEDKRIEA